MHNIGQVYFEQRRNKDAMRYLAHALRLAERLDLKIARSATLTEMARVHLGTGELEDAAALAERAIEAAEEAPDVLEVAEAKTVLATACAMQGRTDRAKVLMKEAVAVFRSHGAHARLAQAARDLWAILMSRGAKADAADQLVIALEAEESLRKRPRS